MLKLSTALLASAAVVAGLPFLPPATGPRLLAAPLPADAEPSFGPGKTVLVVKLCLGPSRLTLRPDGPARLSFGGAGCGPAWGGAFGLALRREPAAAPPIAARLIG